MILGILSVRSHYGLTQSLNSLYNEDFKRTTLPFSMSKSAQE